MNLILDKYFFKYIDEGYKQNETPLFKGVIDGKLLVDVVSQELTEWSAGKIVQEIGFARKEVEL